jgi:hypothetical protein
VLAGAGGAAGEAYAWAIANPDRVACIYAENPRLHCTMTKEQPLEHLDVLAKAHIPILHACGSLDPFLKNHTQAAEAKYKSLGGEFIVAITEGTGHYPTAPHDISSAVTFILQHTATSTTEKSK